jgi:predicted amidophosphoribosyltransferase
MNMRLFLARLISWFRRARPLQRLVARICAKCVRPLDKILDHVFEETMGMCERCGTPVHRDKAVAIDRECL